MTRVALKITTLTGKQASKTKTLEYVFVTFCANQTWLNINTFKYAILPKPTRMPYIGTYYQAKLYK